MSQIFVDSGYWIGLRDKEDDYHTKARRITHWLIDEKAELLVTPFIFAEVQAFFSRMPNIRQQIIGDFWNNPIVRIEQPTLADQEGAVQVLKKQRDKAFSFTDALSFVVMLRLGITTAVSFDQHYRQFGQFEVIDGTLF